MLRHDGVLSDERLIGDVLGKGGSTVAAGWREDRSVDCESASMFTELGNLHVLRAETEAMGRDRPANRRSDK